MKQSLNTTQQQHTDSIYKRENLQLLDVVQKMKCTLLRVHSQLNNYKLKILELEQLKTPD